MRYNYCTQLCRNCIYSYEHAKRLICENGFFDVAITDSILFVSWDFDCCYFESIDKENNNE